MYLSRTGTSNQQFTRPEDFDAEEPERAETEAIAGRKEVGALEGLTKLIGLLDASSPQVICGAANALFNLTLSCDNADALLPLGALSKLTALLNHENAAVQAAVVGVLMNTCATSGVCRSELALSGLLTALLALIVGVGSKPEGDEAEVRKNALGALNNLMLDAAAAKSLRPENGIDILTNLLRVEGHGEARLEDAASSLLRALQEDEKAGEELVEVGGMPVLVATVSSPNEELQVRVCGLIFESCEQVPSARQTLHELKVVAAVLPLISSSAEEVQEAAARAIEKLSRMPACAVAVRRNEGITALIDLMTSLDESVQLAAISALCNVAHSDPKAAAAIRDADGLKPLVAFLNSANTKIQIASASTILGCSRNESNKTVLRELGAIEALLKMTPFSNPRDAQAAAVATLAYLTLNEDEARVLLRLQGGLKKLHALLYANDPMLQAHSAEVFAHCAPNHETRIAMRLADCLAPLVALLSSPHAAARSAAAGALMQATQATRTNQIKCRELGAIAPLLRLLEPPEEGPPDRECQRRGVWTLSNIACEPTAAKQLRQSPSGFTPLILLIAGGDPILQRPASACLFNASANDLGAPNAIESTGGLTALTDALCYAATKEHEEIVASCAGVLVNCAAQKGFSVPMVASEPLMLERLLGAISVDGYVPQTGNAIGALMNITREDNTTVDFMLADPSRMQLLLAVMPANREESAICCHAAGLIGNLAYGDAGREKMVEHLAVKGIIETLEASEDDAQSCACCVAMLNGCYGNVTIREHLLDCGGINALVACLASENVDLKAAAAGALLNASATGGCAEAIREAAVEYEGGTKPPVSGFELLLRLITSDQPLLIARAAGVLFNCAAFGPDTRLAMHEMGVLTGIVACLSNSNTALGAPKHTPKDLVYRIQSNLIGAVLNAALNPTCKGAMLKAGVMAPVVEALGSPDETVQSQASTAIAYLADKAEARPGSPNSTLTSVEDPAQLTKTKLRFHDEKKAEAGGPSSSQAEEPDDAPGARTKASIGLIPKAKVSATHDSHTKAARFVQEQPETYGRRLTTCVEPENMEDPYEEVPSPLPSPRDM